MAENRFKLLGMQVEEFCRVRLARLAVNGSTLEISGKNFQGKTSLVNALWTGLGGPTAMKDMGITQPVKAGAEAAKIYIDLDELLVYREFKADGTMKLIVTNKDGFKMDQGQTILDAFRGKLFDISAFGRMDGKRQLDLILPIIDLKLDMGTWTAERNKLYEERTMVNREVKQLEGQLAGIPPTEAPDEEVSVSSIAAEMEAAQQIITANNEKRQELADKKKERDLVRNAITFDEQELTTVREKIAELQLRETALVTSIADRQKDISVINDEGRVIQQIVESLVDPDLSGFKTRMAEVEDINANVRKKKERETVISNLEAKKTESDSLTLKIEGKDKEKADAIKAAQWPIDGMGIDEDGLTYNGAPITQASDAQNLFIGYAVAKALSPRFPVLRLSRPGDLDQTNYEALTAQAEADGYLLVIEKVSDGKEGLVIEDGELDSSTTPGVEKIIDVAKPKRSKKATTVAEGGE